MVLPIAAAILVLLLVLREPRHALAWLLAVLAVLATMLALKLTLAGCRPPSPLSVLRSPSGHAAQAAVVYGGLGALLGAGVAATAAQALAVAGVIGVSRVLLAAHSFPEALLGGGVGLAGAAALAAWLQRRPPTKRRAIAVSAPLVAVALAGALHGTHWSAEPLIHRAPSHVWPLHACTA